MKTISVSAHFDGEHIRLDEPIGLERNTKLTVTILPKDKGERLVEAYSETEEEYPVDSMKEANPEYEVPIPHKSNPR